MKILIIGGSGLLGQYLNLELSANHRILTTYHRNPGNTLNFPNVKLDATDFALLEKTFKEFRPEAVILTAAVSNPAAAQNAPRELVIKLNVEVPEFTARLCAGLGAKLIYTSTDLVYDGNGNGNLTEESELNPVSLYAETKLAGEEKIRSVLGNSVILRTALLYGSGLNHSVNHFTTIYKNLQEGIPVKLFYDQFRSPLALQDAARMINEITGKNIAGETINFGGAERLSRYDLGEILCEEAGFDKELLRKISMDEIDNFIKVKDVSMNIDKLKSFGIKPAGVRESIKKILDNRKS